MPVMARATPSCWMPTRWRKRRAGTIRAAAFSIRFSPDGFGGPISERYRRGRADLRRAGFPAGCIAEGAQLAPAFRRGCQLPAATGLGGATGEHSVAASRDAGGPFAVVGAASALAGSGGTWAFTAVRCCHGRQCPARAHPYRLRLRPGYAGSASELGAGGAQFRAGGAAVAVVCGERAGLDGHRSDRCRRRPELLPALSAVQYLLRAAARPL